MLELNAKECQALEDTLLGSGGKRGPVNFVRYFGGAFYSNLDCLEIIANTPYIRFNPQQMKNEQTELGILWRQSQQGSSPSQSKL